METIYETMEGNMDRQSITNTLASNIKFLRINTKIEKFNGKVKYMTQTDLAEFMNSKTQQVSKFELAKNQMSAKSMSLTIGGFEFEKIDERDYFV